MISVRTRDPRWAAISKGWPIVLVGLCCVAVGASVAVIPDPRVLLAAVAVLLTITLVFEYWGATGMLMLLFGGVALVPLVADANGTAQPTLSAVRTLLIAALAGLASIQLAPAGGGGLSHRARAVAGGLATMAVLGAVVTAFTSDGYSDYLKQVSQAAGQPLAYMVVFVVLIWLFQRDPAARQLLVAAWCVGLVAEGIIVAGQLATGAAYDPLRGFTRAQGTMGADFLGVFAAMGVFAGAYLRAISTSMSLRRLGDAAIVAGAFSLTAAITRGSLIGLGLGLLWLVACTGADIDRRRRLLQVVGVALVMGLSLYAMQGLWQARLNSPSTASFDRSASWISGARIVADNPLVGVGPRHVAEVVASRPRYSSTSYGETLSNPHNSWLFVAAGEGILYALLLAWVGVAFLRALAVGARSPSRRYLFASLIAGGTVFFTNNLFNHPEIVLYVILAGALLTTERAQVLEPQRTARRRATRDVPPFAVVMGVPARVSRWRFEGHARIQHEAFIAARLRQPDPGKRARRVRDADQ